MRGVGVDLRSPLAHGYAGSVPFNDLPLSLAAGDEMRNARGHRFPMRQREFSLLQLSSTLQH